MTLEETIRATVREAVAEALGEFDFPEMGAGSGDPPEEDWRSRVHRVHPETRLSLQETAQALGCSTRTVRRHLEAEPPLPHRKGPSGITVSAGELLTWIRDVEEGSRFGKANP